MPRTVLVTNDDGIESPGLWALVRALQPLDCEVVVVAPSLNQSAVGGSLTLRQELRWTRVEDPPVPGANAWHVNGSPASAVIVGLHAIATGGADLVVSGINQGANLGNDLLASGTVGAALQSHFRGITSLALSYAMTPRTEVDWTTAERVATMICREEIEGRLPASVFLNVNIPLVDFEEVAGIVVTRASRHGYFRLKQESDETGQLEREPFADTGIGAPPGTDIWALQHKYVSVSPIQANLTDHRVMDELGDKLNAAWRE